ncbi:MAG TPA: asparagine synthetase B, partial [candidate division Zixibacteria bacterium]
MFRKIIVFLFFLYFILILLPKNIEAQKLLIPMDLSQTDHLKAYGVAYWVLEQGLNVEWLLNYRGGSFLADFSEEAADI